MGKDLKKFPGLRNKRQRDQVGETIGDAFDILFLILEKYKILMPAPGPMLPGNDGIIPADLFLPIDWSNLPREKG